MSPEEAIKEAIMYAMNCNTSDQKHVTSTLRNIVDLLRPALEELEKEV